MDRKPKSKLPYTITRITYAVGHECKKKGASTSTDYDYCRTDEKKEGGSASVATTTHRNWNWKELHVEAVLATGPSGKGSKRTSLAKNIIITFFFPPAREHK